jgi:lambda repressor-like predicted transcriptional regulator
MPSETGSPKSVRALHRRAMVEQAARLYAKTFAEFAWALLRKAAAEEVAAVRSAKLIPDPTASLETAPQWLKDASERAKAADPADDVTTEELLPKVARDCILQAMHEKGISQAGLAKALGKSPASVCRILKSPDRSRLRTLRQIAEAIGVDIGSLLKSA